MTSRRGRFERLINRHKRVGSEVEQVDEGQLKHGVLLAQDPHHDQDKPADQKDGLVSHP